MSDGRRRVTAATLYPLVGLEGTRYSFRVLRVREPVPHDNLRPVRLQRWADRLWRHELRCPVYCTMQLGHPDFLIPNDASPPVGSLIKIVDVPDKVYHIEVTGLCLEVSMEDAVGASRELVCRMIERAFADRLVALRDRFWRGQWTLFFRMRPENEGGTDAVNAYRGFKFGVVFVQDAGPHLAVDVRTKYVGRRSLLEFAQVEKESVLHRHLNLRIPVHERAYFLRDNGFVKIPCRYTGETGHSVSECTFDGSGETVYEYYRERYPELGVVPHESAVFVQDRENESSVPVPVSRLFPIFTTEYEGLRTCSVRPQIPPEERAREIGWFLDHLSGVTYGRARIHVGDTLLMQARSVFVPPRLEFGNSQILEAFPPGRVPDPATDEFDRAIVRWRSSKLPALYRWGPYHNEPLPDVVLLYPQSIDRPTREMFLRELEQEVSRQTGQNLQVVQQRSYAGERPAQKRSALLRASVDLRSADRRFLALVVLADELGQGIHGELKDLLGPVLSQCVTERVMRNIVSKRDPQRATSQLRNLTLGVLTEAGVKPWVLADPLHFDLYIGIDVLYGMVGYHFLYGPGGRIVRREFGQTIARGRAQEAVKKPDLKTRLEQGIRLVVQQGYRVDGLVIHRDGRWWPRESEALRSGLEHLKGDGVLPGGVRYAVVEIRKTHMPIRLFTGCFDGACCVLRNPLPGSFLTLDRSRVILSTTGRPGAWDTPGGRTAGTLLLEVVECAGDIDIREIAEDAFRLTQLNWAAPDIDLALPVTIRWTDEAVRQMLRSESAEDEEDFADTSLDSPDEEGMDRWSVTWDP